MSGGLYLCHNLTGTDFAGVDTASPLLVGPCSWALDPSLLPNGGGCFLRFGGALTGTASVSFRVYVGGSRFHPGITGSTPDGTLIFTAAPVTGPLTPVIVDVGPVVIGPGLTRMKFGYTSSGGSWSLDNWFWQFYAFPPAPPVGGTPPDPTVTERGDDLDVRGDLARSAFSLADGVRNIGNALARRLITPRGGLLYDAAYGTDVRSYVNAGFTAAGVARIASEVQAEVTKDPRVESADVTVRMAGTVMTIVITVELPQGPFELMFRVDGLAVDLLSVLALGGG